MRLYDPFTSEHSGHMPPMVAKDERLEAIERVLSKPLPQGKRIELIREYNDYFDPENDNNG